MRHFAITATAIRDVGDKITAAIEMVDDITERKQAEESLRKSEAKLLELNIQKDKFFSIIAHDLRSLFNSIKGFSELLTDQIKKKDFEGIDKYAKIISESSQVTMSLLMNLLDWAGSQTGRMEFNPEYFELVNLAEETFSQLKDSAEKLTDPPGLWHHHPQR